MTASSPLIGTLFAGVLLAAVLASLGVLATLRRMSFFGDGIAHASLAGIAIGIIIGANPLLSAVIFSALAALVIYFFERKTILSSDATIGVMFTASMSLGVILAHLAKKDYLNLEDFLFGNELSVEKGDVVLISLISIVVIALLIWLRHELMLLSFDREYAYLAGAHAGVIDAVFYVMLAVVVVLGAKMLGIVLASAMLVIPASAAKVLCRSFAGLTLCSVIIAELTMIGGLLLARALGLPSGAVVVLTGTFLLFLSTLIYLARKTA